MIHENAQIFKDEGGVILEAQFYNGDDGLHGMRGLLTGAPANSFTTIKATSLAPRATVLAALKVGAATISITRPRRARHQNKRGRPRRGRPPEHVHSGGR